MEEAGFEPGSMTAGQETCMVGILTPACELTVLADSVYVGRGEGGGRDSGKEFLLFSTNLKKGASQR